MKHTDIKVDDKLRLRQLHLSEAEEIFRLVDEDREYLGKWLPWVEATKSVSDNREFLATVIQDREAGTSYGFGIIYDGTVVGHTSLMLNRGEHPEIGYWIASKFTGQGITTRAARALTEFGFQELGLKTIIIKADPENHASNRVAEKLGYTLTKTVPDGDDQHMMNIWTREA